MTGKRSRLEIYLEVLDVVRHDVDKPTRIMYAANISWKPLQEIIATLLENGLIHEEETKLSKRYTITDKGKSALSYFRKAKELILAEPMIP
jgi:predicted transcriptional regulator